MNMPIETELSKTKENIWCFIWSFIENCSKFIEHKLQKLTKHFCEEEPNAEIVSSTYEFTSFFSSKYEVPYGLKFFVI